ncbi:MAG: DegV family protein [Chloroflexi bacterium]|nr:MAG: DegV family protein [Chloroflexota bacterium]MBL1193638.1 DegV family protein [Chloroflexota bacterium]NOH10930.1 DegV family protein [Chloroflexota bacterium]
MKIVTDSAADLPPQDVQDLDVTIAPQFIQFPEGEVSAEDITPDDFYDRLKGMVPDVPTTAMPSPGMFSEIYEQTAGPDEDILSLHISSGLSGTIDAARIAAEQSSAPIEIVDTMTLSGGERFQVLYAAQAAKAGVAKDKIIEHLKNIRGATEVVYTLETLEYLQRGGRIGRVQAMAGALLNLKPVIKVDKADGKYSTVGKDRTLRKAMSRIVAHLTETYGTQQPMWVTVLHGQFSEKADILANMIQDKLQIDKMEVLRISPVLGVHTGPGIVGVATVPMEVMSN